MIIRVRHLFNAVYGDELRISVPRIQALIETYQERHSTGLIRLAYPNEERLYLLFKRGEVINSYLSRPDSWEVSTLEQWPNWMEVAGEAYARLAPISTFALLLLKILLQTPRGHSEIFAGTNALAHALNTAQPRLESAIISLDWDNAGGLLFFGRDSISPHSIFVSQDDLRDEHGLTSAFQERKELWCVVTTCVPDLNVDAWQEYYLRRAFAGVCERALARFEAITGRAMADSLIRLVAVYASQRNLEISITARRMTDREVFSSPQQAAENYRGLIQEFFKHFSSIIGPRLLSAMLSDITASLNPLEFQVAHQFELFSE